MISFFDRIIGSWRKQSLDRLIGETGVVKRVLSAGERRTNAVLIHGGAYDAVSDSDIGMNCLVKVIGVVAYGYLEVEELEIEKVKDGADNIDTKLSYSVFRDFHDQWNGNVASKTIDLTSDYAPKSIRGHDFVVHNLGGHNITVAVDGGSGKTVKKYDTYSFYKTEWYELVISNPNNCDVEVTIVGEVL